METALNPAQQDVLGLLRNDPEDRLVVSTDLRRALQAELDENAKGMNGSFRLTKHDLTQVHRCEGLWSAEQDSVFEWDIAKARGTLAHKAIELSIHGTTRVTPMRVVDTAISRICEDRQTESLANYVRDLDQSGIAQLRSDTVDLVTKYCEMFPPIPEGWRANAEATTSALTKRNGVVLYGKIDLKLGSPNGTRSGSLILDFKTGNPSFSDLDDLRFYALLETLRLGVPPFRWASIYLSAGRFESEDASEAVLWSALRRTCDALHKILEIKNGRPTVLTPGPGCKFCPARPTCPSAEN